MERGLFVVFEGGEGSGKSTQAELLAKNLEASGWDVWLTKEPGGTDAGLILREFLLHNKRERSGLAELMLFETDRILHVDEIFDRLEFGQTVICDRYIDSTLAYQGYARGEDIGLIKKCNEAATLGLYPDITYFMRVPVEVGLARVNSRQDRNTRFDDEEMEFHRKLHDGYDTIVVLDRSKYVVVNGELPKEEIAQGLLADFLERTKEVA